MNPYDHKTIETKWQHMWDEQQLHRADDANSKPKYYALDMYPYPSGAGLHVGHPKGYTATDIISRKKRMEGCEVLHPMGWDAFGLPAENYAIKTGTPPAESTEKNIETFTRQIKSLGFSYDWQREVATCRPDYYRWTQWWFLFLYKQGLAYKKEAPVNWCPGCVTVLANEQVVQGCCERCDSAVEQKKMNQWFFKITDFIEDQRTPAKPVRAVLLHGWGGSPESNFLPWLKAELEKAGWQVDVPELPNAENPDPEAWLAALDELKMDENTVVVGHSLGGTIITRWLELNKTKLKKVVLVGAPTQTGGKHPKTESVKALPVSSAIRQLAEFEILYSADDPFVTAADTAALSELCAEPIWQFDGRGHFQEKESAEILQAAATSKTSGLLSGLDKIDWPESTKISQRNWIGKSEGAEVDFAVDGSDEKITVFTTRPDTLFGCTFMVLAPEHELVASLTTDEQRAEVEKYIEEAASKTDLDRQSEKEKTGVFTGGYAVNPVNGEKVPIWIADYVLASYGTGAIMAVPAHDERDFEFAQKFGIEIKRVVAKSVEDAASELSEAETIAGIAINSDFLDGLPTAEAKTKMIDWLEEKKLGKGETTYKLRDWLVSRQRYWGCPIPIIHCPSCGEVPVPEDQLPVELPTDVDFVPTGESPLHQSETFHDVSCPKCGSKEARRESDTMDTFVCSSWYFFRFADPQNANEMAAKELLAKWMPVDLYVGGAEHTVLHLLYSRFFTKVARRAGISPVDEPFAKLRHQGMILGEDGNKMSKSKGNVINPDEIVEKYGADTLRCYEMFMGPFADSCPWSTSGTEGIHRFLMKIWRLFEKDIEEKPAAGCPTAATPDVRRIINQTIKKVTEDTDNFKFNTAISQMMICVNELGKKDTLPRPLLQRFLKLLAPYAPHMTEEIWRDVLGNPASIHLESWPEWHEKWIAEDNITLAVQVNGKLRDTIQVAADISQDDAIKAAKATEKVQSWLEGKELVKEIVVPGKLVNLVINNLPAPLIEGGRSA